MPLKGGPELQARLRAIGQALKPMGRAWADEAVNIGRPMVPVRTGRLRESMRRKSATQTKATVVAHYSAYFVDAGVKPHSLARRQKGESRTTRSARTIFHKKHPGYRARPFRERMAREALRRKPLSAELIAAWNRARAELRG